MTVRPLAWGATRPPAVPLSAYDALPTWSANFCTGSLPGSLSFSRSSSARYFNSSGWVASASTDAARLSYNPVTLTRRGLLVEGARTNEQLNSANLGGANYTFTKTSADNTKSTTGLDGASWTQRLKEDTQSGTHQMPCGSITTVNATVYSIWGIFEADDATCMQLTFGSSGFGSGLYANFDLGNGVGGTKHANVTSKITSLGHSKYLCQATATSTGAAGTNVMNVVLTNNNASASAAPSYVGSSKGLWVHHVQVEKGPFASSVIPTTAIGVTRAADLAGTASLSGIGFSHSEGTLLVEAEFVGISSGTAQRLLQVDDGSAANRLYIGQDSGDLKAVVTTSSSDVASLTAASSISANTVYKAALTYRGNDFAACVNGGGMVTDSAGALPTGLTTLRIGQDAAGASNANAWIRKVAYYPQCLPNGLLRSLTM